MPKNPNIRKVLVIGSGPIVIGQAAEFDYAGAQACRVLRQEGIRTVLVNSNPATIMTDKHLADAIYLEPLTAETLRRIIALERPDGLLAGLGGQTGLTLAMQLTRDGTLESTACSFSAPASRPSSAPRTASASARPWPRWASPSSPPPRRRTWRAA